MVLDFVKSILNGNRFELFAAADADKDVSPG